MSGSLLQLLIRGQEDTHILSEGFDAYRPFRQVVRRAVSFATQWVDIDAALPSSKVFGETLKVTVPRKGDVLNGVMVAFKVKRAAGTSLLPGLQLIEEATLSSGRQILETIPAEYMLLKHYCQDDTDEQATTARLASFQNGETQGLIKTMYVKIPFFVEKTPLPLIAVQNMNLELEIKFGNAPLALDPTFQPRVSLLLQYAYVDDDERRFYARNEHALLIERLQVHDEPITMRKSIVSKIYTAQEDALGDYDSVVGAGELQSINLGDRVALVDNPAWVGKTEIFYNTESPASFSLQGRFLVSQTGDAGVRWATYTDGGTEYGYTLDISVSSNIMTVTLKRDGTTFSYFTNAEVFSDVRTSVTGDSSPSTDLTPQFAAGEAWLVFNITHNLETPASGIQLVLTAEGYVQGGYLADIARVNYNAWTYTFVEGYAAVDTIDKLTTYSFYADSQYDCLLTDTTYDIQRVSIVPVSNNLNAIQTRLFFRGPIRYLLWCYTKAATGGVEPFGVFNTSGDTSTLERHNILHSARLLLNGQDKTGTMPSVFYNTVETARVFKKPVPAGVHCISFALDPLTLQPNGSCNFSQLQSIVLAQDLKSYSETITSDILELDETETVASGQAFNRIKIFAVGWNILRIVNGGVSLGYV